VTRSGSIFVVGALAVAACQPQPSTTPADAAPPTAAEAPKGDTEAAPAEPAGDDPTLAALERVPKVLEGVAAVRKLEFKEEIGAAKQSTEDFTKFINAELDKELPKDKSAALSKALHHVGLLEKPVDLRETLTSALVSQVGAYYDPLQGKFFVVMAANIPMLADVMNAHELTHGLQDQHFDLETYVGEGEQKGKIDFSTDEITARRFVVEGEATLVMSAYPSYVAGQGLMLEDERMMQIIDQQVTQQEQASVTQLLALNAQQSQAQAKMMGEDFAKAAEALDDLPPYVTVPLMLPYVRGMTAVYRVYKEGGWEAVNDLYAHPPTSTEQVLHPVDKLIGKRDEPVAVTIDTKAKALEGWEVVEDDTLGELMWQVYFSLWKVPELEPAAGWGGDQAVFLAKDGKQMAVMTTVWDTAEDAKQFHEAYAQSLAARFGKDKGATKGSKTTFDRGDDTQVLVQRKGKMVAVVDGADAKASKNLVKLALKAKTK
jgi:hypothetical protein